MGGNPLVVVRGGGDLATGVAWHLHKAGARVVMTELPHPKMVRHTVSLGYAVYNGQQTVEGVTAVLSDLDECLREDDSVIPVIIDDDDKAIPFLRPHFIFDGRMLKHCLPDARPQAAVTVGLGPGFVAGSRWNGQADFPQANVDMVIETMRGSSLAQVLTSGAPIADTGVPGVIAGESARRLLRAPQNGIFRGVRQVGDIIAEGDIVGYVEDSPVRTALSGRLRGLVHDGLYVQIEEKIGDCDPRGRDVSVYVISDKAHAIGMSALSIFTLVNSRSSLQKSQGNAAV